MGNKIYQIFHDTFQYLTEDDSWYLNSDSYSDSDSDSDSDLKSDNVQRIDAQIKAGKWWGLNSIILSDECLLSKLKKFMSIELLAMEILEEKDLGNRNMTPHITVRNVNKFSKADYKKNDQKIFDELNNLPYTIYKNSLVIERNLLTINLGTLNLFPIHFTVLFKKDIHDHAKDIDDLYQKWLVETYDQLKKDDA